MISTRSIVCSAAFLAATALTPVTSWAAQDGMPAATRQPHVAAISASCSSTKVDYTASNNGGSFTTSESFVDIPEGSVTFAQRRTGCILVKFDGMGFAGGTALEFVAALLDGTEMFPGDIQFTGGDSTWASSHAASWVATNVAAGTHTVQMEFRSKDGQNVYIIYHTTAVSHK